MIFGVFDMGAGTLLLTDALHDERGWPVHLARALPAPGLAAVGKPLHCRVFTRAGQKRAIRKRRGESGVSNATVRSPCGALRRGRARRAGHSCNRCGCPGTSPSAAQCGRRAADAAHKKGAAIRLRPCVPPAGERDAGDALPHFTSNCCGVPAALPSTVTSAVYLPAGQPLGLLNVMLVVPVSVALSVALCSPAFWPSW